MPDPASASRDIQFQWGLSPQAVRGMAEFVKKHYLDPNMGSLASGLYRETWSTDGRSVDLEWGFSPPIGHGRLAEGLTGNSIRLSVGSSSASIRFPGLITGDASGLAACARVADDLDVLINTFLTKLKTTSLYFIFSVGERGGNKDFSVSSRPGGDALRRLLRGNMTNLYLLIMGASFVLFFALGNYAIFAVIAIQLLALVYSDRVALLVGKVRPSAEMPKVRMVCVRVSQEMKGAVGQLAKVVVSDLSAKLESRLSPETLDGPGAAEAAKSVLETAGIKAAADEIKIITRDVYGLVKGVADRFRLPVPKIAIMNSFADNAAATGVSPSRSSITITAGSLEDLSDAELSSVIGHELGHIRGRDSLILFSTTFILYLGGLYLWFPLLLALGLVYYLLVFAIIFSIGKVLETRADTESVEKLGEPGVLASALTSIGYRQLYAERYSHGARLLDWLTFDPHPPIYFRVQRLTELQATGKNVGNTLFVSIRDCVTGFFGAIF